MQVPSAQPGPPERPAGLDEPREDADVETSSEDYARRFAGPVGEWFIDVQSRHTLGVLSPWPQASVLEVGGGHGQLTGALVDSGRTVTVYASDERCRARLARLVDAGRAGFASGDLLHAPFEDRGFDAVLCFRLLPHARRWPALVAELCRVARATVVVDYPSARSVNAAAGPLFGLKKDVEGDTRPFRVFRDREVGDEFAAHGFHLAGRRPQFFVPMALHRALGWAGISRAVEAVATGAGPTALLGSPVIARFDRDG